MDFERALRVVAESHGYSEVKDKQKDTIIFVCKWQRCFCCVAHRLWEIFLLPESAMLFDILHGHDVPTSVVVVVTSLIAIMKEQVSELGSKQICAVYVLSNIDDSVESEILDGKFGIVYISPELLLRQTKWREMLRSDVYKENLVGFIVDEASMSSLCIYSHNLPPLPIVCRGDDF